MDEEIELTGAPSFDAAHFRTVLGHFCSGIVIVTGMDAGEPVGLTAQSFLSLSLAPPLVAFAPAKTSSSWPRIRDSGSYCVNVLAEDQEEVCRTFATSGADKFSSVGWRQGRTGSPILNGVLAWIDCRIVAEHEGGDHTIAIGQAIDLDMAARGRPLLFYRGGYGRFES
jgi:3-hydroxy-9,10-secoandrosta-1,3,5(10)-triene-9,17-dione monooxygenase reductase component